MIGLLDPAIGTANTGDLIISSAVKAFLAEYEVEFAEFSTRGPWDRATRRRARACNYFLLGGTNILTSDPRVYRQWLLGWRDLPAVRRRTVLLGVGWWQYQDAPTSLGRAFIRETLHPGALHSVRDAFTGGMLAGVGMRTANTACPTMWPLDGFRSPAVASCRRVVATVTDYAADPERDTVMLNQLRETFAEVVIWPQGGRDRRYLDRLGREESILPDGLDAFHNALRAPGTGYVGTRLHAGVAALVAGVPSLIVSIDNRAREIAVDTGLPVIDRSDLGNLSERVTRDSTPIRLPVSEIARWKTAFHQLVA